MQKVNLFTRLTHKYASGWRHLDNEQFLCTVRITPPRMVVEPTDYDNGGIYAQFVRIPAGMPFDQFSQALYDTLSGSSCRHEYDCCGCATRRVSTEKVSPRKAIIRTSVSYNY